ncbi:hypothetical protein [Halorubrum sp. CSM-61]|uniref:hypothetical protein n=1 Tax=Halorubrum sp. CSM-61 TaxID=2485838 RepID=UPI000F4B3DCC|nr:hypothetical protein [Halorubrum sp. CSM-61]
MEIVPSVAVVGIIAVLLISATASGALAASTTDANTASQYSVEDTCQTEIAHDAFRAHNQTVSKLQNESKAQSTVDNTRVTVAETSGFYRVTGENPNGYCVGITVQVSEDAMPAAKIPGSIESNDGNHSATWDAIHDFNTSETYTEVTFVLPPDTTATFAPSEARVLSLSWASERTEKAQSVADRLTERFFDKDLEQRQYTLSPDNEQEVTVPLKNPNTDEQVDEWQAMYTTDDEQSWNTLTRESSEKVYITESDEQQVTFRFNDPEAEVRFTANPNFREKTEHEVREYLSGIPDLFSDGSEQSFDAPIAGVTAT